ncbi:MAG: MalY/PatB family protein [Acidimicrobiales bacterium]
MRDETNEPSTAWGPATQDQFHPRLTATAQASDVEDLKRHYGRSDGMIPLWIAEPYVELAPGVIAALETRASAHWYGYETRPAHIIDAFWEWMSQRHQWDRSGLHTVVSPSVGTSIGVLIEQHSSPGDGVILQPPVFTDFKPLVTSAGRAVVRNALQLSGDGYHMDLDGLAAAAAATTTRVLIVCNPHNPVGRVWKKSELAAVAEICAKNDVFVIADEIHADITLESQTFTPFATLGKDSDVQWAALHGPIKTFGLAGVCDSLLITNNEQVATLYEARSSQLHLSRNNVFGLAAFEAAYRTGADWVDGLLELVTVNKNLLDEQLPSGIELSPMEGTYLAWLDFRRLDMNVPTLAGWLASSVGLGLSPGHWFGREGAGFARMSIAAPTSVIDEAVARLRRAVSALGYDPLL